MTKKQSSGALVGVLALFAGVMSYSFGAYYDGKVDAHLDLMRGRYRIRVYGSRGANPYWGLLSRKYGIEHEVVADCVVTQEIVEEAHGYNEVMHAAIEGRFGEDIFSEARLEAELAHESEPSLLTPQHSE